MFSLYRKIDPKAKAMVQYMVNHPTGDIFGDTPRIVLFDGFRLDFNSDGDGGTKSIFLNQSDQGTYSCVEIFNIYNSKKEVKALDKARRIALYRYHKHLQENAESRRLEALKNLNVDGIK